METDSYDQAVTHKQLAKKNTKFMHTGMPLCFFFWGRPCLQLPLELLSQWLPSVARVEGSFSLLVGSLGHQTLSVK
jgi:hypothetical protein